MISGVSVNTQRLRTRLRTVPGFVRKEAMPIAAGVVISEIIEMTDAGLGPDGTIYPPLTPAYKKRKTKLQLPGIRDYRVTGALKKSLHFSPGASAVTVGEDQKPKAEGLSKKGKFLITSKAMGIRAAAAIIPRLQQFIR